MFFVVSGDWCWNELAVKMWRNNRGKENVRHGIFLLKEMEKFVTYKRRRRKGREET